MGGYEAGQRFYEAKEPGDFSIFVRKQLSTKEGDIYWVEFEVFECVAMEGIHPLFERKDSKLALDNPTWVTDDAVRFLRGHIKWDGCSNWEFSPDDETMIHFCSREQAVQLGVLMNRLYDIAKEIMGRDV